MGTGDASQRRWVVAVVVAACLVFAVAAWLISQPHTSSDTTIPKVSTWTSHKGDGSAPVAAFIGDSYTQGHGASSPDKRWSSKLAASQGWTELNLGRGGTGYVSVSGMGGCGLDYCPSYPEMVADALPSDVDIVVLAGGQNDFNRWQEDEAGVTDAIRTTITALRAKVPEARIVIVGPSTPWEEGKTVTDMSAVIGEAARGIDATFIPLIAPAVLPPEVIADDGLHPDDRGHFLIAKRVAQGLPG